MTRREFAGALGLSAAASFSGCGPAQLKGDPEGRKVIVLGLDGMDPKIIQALMDEGRAPNFKRLAEMGAFKPLGTTMPALSPVAWSSFITGMTPGGHGVPDFIARDKYTYMPYFSFVETRDIDRSITIGDYEIPLSGGETTNKRAGKPFWAYLTEAGIPATVIKIPTNFPVDETATRGISGMGTPDLTDSFGLFTYYTSDPDEEVENLSGGELVRVRVRGGRVDAEFLGPENTIDKSASGRTKKPFSIYVDPTEPVVRVDVDGQMHVIQEGEYSDWIKLRFELIPYVASVAGIARVYVKQVHPHLQVYVTPINIDPEDQAAPVTYPAELGGEIAQHIGPFWTKGLPTDTKAFSVGIFNDGDYVTQAELVLQDRLNLFNYEWDRFKDQSSGLFYFYVSSTDQDAHMLWRNMDKSHPMHHASDVRYSGYIHHLYEEMDKLVGQVLPAVDEKTLLVVCSDHGFAQFGRNFHLNTWLRDNGYLTIKDEAKSKERTNISDIDWNNTIAYGIGFNGLYLNIAGREEQGIVGSDKAPELVKRISSELEAVLDDETGRPPVHHVFDRSEVYSGEFTPEMPEMLVGYTPGFRCSDNSLLGETGSSTVDVNQYPWAGDHSMSRDLVPGSLFISRTIQKANPDILDLPVTILEFFGFTKPDQMVGKSLFKV